MDTEEIVMRLRRHFETGDVTSRDQHAVVLAIEAIDSVDSLRAERDRERNRSDALHMANTNLQLELDAKAKTIAELTERLATSDKGRAEYIDRYNERGDRLDRLEQSARAMVDAELYGDQEDVGAAMAAVRRALEPDQAPAETLPQPSDRAREMLAKAKVLAQAELDHHRKNGTLHAPADAEREHCHRIVFGRGPQSLTYQVDEMVRVRAEVRAECWIRTQEEIAKRLETWRKNELANMASAKDEGVRAERERCLAARPLGWPGEVTNAYMDAWQRRIKSGDQP